jgi:hypothetical protein
VGQESCLDGADNDGDGLVDCADTDDCSADAYECVDGPPAGWTAGVRAAKAAYPSGGSLPMCPEGMTPTDHFAGPAQAADCSACNCALSGAACTAPEVECYWGSSSCQNGADVQHQDSQNDQCHNHPNVPSSTGSCEITGDPDVITPGTCTFGAGDGQLVAPTWMEEVRVCTAAAGGGCGDTRVCVPKAPVGSGVDGAVCIAREGTDACPSGWTIETQTYQSGTDNRACSACACEMDTVDCTGGGWEAYEFENCFAVFSYQKATITTQCTTVSSLLGSQFSLRATAATPEPPTECSAQGNGAVDAQGPMKLCCMAQP